MTTPVNPNADACANCNQVIINNFKTIIADPTNEYPERLRWGELKICNLDCFMNLNIPAVHPLNDTPLINGSQELNQFITNIGYILEFYNDPHRLSKILPSFFMLILGSTHTNHNTELKPAHDTLSSFPELSILKLKQTKELPPP